MWSNSFYFHMLTIWNANPNSQFMLDSYASVTYCICYMMKLNKTMTNTFKMYKKSNKTNSNFVQTIGSLGKSFQYL